MTEMYLYKVETRSDACRMGFGCHEFEFHSRCERITFVGTLQEMPKEFWEREITLEDLQTKYNWR